MDNDPIQRKKRKEELKKNFQKGIDNMQAIPYPVNTLAIPPDPNEETAMRIIMSQKIVTRLTDDGETYASRDSGKRVTVIDDDDMLTAETLNAIVVNAIKNQLSKKPE